MPLADSRRSQLSWCMGYIADISRRFFHPAAIEEMLSTFLPGFNGTNLDVSSFQQNSHTFLSLPAERPFVTVLSSDLLTIDTSSIISPYVMPFVGVHQLLHVR
jgi:hypothetical protein